jgi:predicted amidohydrolase
VFSVTSVVDLRETKDRMFKLALIQMLVEGGAPERNLARAAERIATAAANGAQMCLLPEALDCGWTHGSAHAEAGRIPDGRACEVLRRAAVKHGVFVCAGLIERAGERLFNAAVLIDPQGELVLHQRKINELDIAHDLYARGDRLGVADTPLGRLGLMICADAFAPGQVISRTLGLMGAEAILSPCAWAVPADHDNAKEPYGQLWLDNYRPVAQEHGLWIAGCSNVGPITDGPWRGRRCIGSSLVIGPDGSTVAQGPYGESAETILLVEVRPARRRD